jgi:hypothetical protein
MLKENEVAFLKTTGEAIFILSFLPEEGTVAVRRPVAGQDGLRHVVENFRVQEIESLDDQQARFISERQKVMDKFGPKTEQSPSQDAGFPIN